jgi:hypothetical protein
MMIHSWMMNGAEMFLLAHEYAHLVCGHLYDEREWPPQLRLAMQREPGMALQARNLIRQSQEFEADTMALRIVKSILSNRTTSLEADFVFGGIGAMFSLSYIVERLARSELDYEQHLAG